MSFNTSRDSYNKAMRMYQGLNDLWYKLESGLGEHVEYEAEKLLDDLKIFGKLMDKVDIADFKGKIPPEKIEDVKHNKILFSEGLALMRKHAKAVKYADELRVTIPTFIRKLNLAERDYNQIAPNEKELAKKIIAALTHPDNVEDFELEIKRMGKGKMQLPEFYKIYNTIKGHIIRPADKRDNGTEFKSLRNYSSLEKPQIIETIEQWQKRLEKWFGKHFSSNKKPAAGFRIKK